MAEQIKILFGVKTPGVPWNIVLDMGTGPNTEREGDRLLNFGTPSYLRNG